MPMFQITNPPPFDIQPAGNEILYSVVALVIVAACVIFAIASIDKEERENVPETASTRARKNTTRPRPVNRSRYQASSRRP